MPWYRSSDVCWRYSHVSGKTCDAVADKQTKNFEKVSAWCLLFDTKHLEKKVCFSIKKLPTTESLNVRIKGELIEQVTEMKYSGIILDQLNVKSY